MSVVNPCKYAQQFRNELIIDLELTPSLCCPKCIITYVDNWTDGCCSYSASKEPVLNCIYDFENTNEEEAIREWQDGVLKMLRRYYRDDLEEKWRQYFANTLYK